MKLKKKPINNIRVRLDYLSISSRENDAIKLLRYEETIKEYRAENVGGKYCGDVLAVD